MFHMSVGVAEHIVRAVIVYFFLFAVFRFLGKKHVGDLSPFDLVVLLILSETVQNAMVGDDTSLSGGLVSAGTLFVLAHGMGRLSYSSKRLERLLEGRPRILVRHGRRCRDTMRREQISVSELMEALRRNDCASIDNVRTAILENDGKISIIKRSASG